MFQKKDGVKMRMKVMSGIPSDTQFYISLPPKSQSASLFSVNAEHIRVMGSVKIKGSNPPKDPFLFKWAHTGPLCGCCLCVCAELRIGIKAFFLPVSPPRRHHW